MKRALLILTIAICFVTTLFAQESRKKPQYKSTTKQTKVVKERHQVKTKTIERSKVKEQPKKTESHYEVKQEVRREPKPKETDRFVDKDNNGVNDLTEKRKKKELPESFLNVIEKLLKKRIKKEK